MEERITIKAPKGANKQKKFLGRGTGSGRGGKCGKGDKGQNSRSGGGVRPGFEGGQMPLYRRIARKGFSNHPFKKEYQIVNLKDINNKYQDGDRVDKASLKEKKLIKKTSLPVKILGVGEVDKKLTVSVEKVSKSVVEKINAAGGMVSETGTAVKTDGKVAKDVADSTSGRKGAKAGADSNTGGEVSETGTAVKTDGQGSGKESAGTSGKQPSAAESAAEPEKEEKSQEDEQKSE